jgi:predicted TPR repeat methyltransferase
MHCIRRDARLRPPKLFNTACETMAKKKKIDEAALAAAYNEALSLEKAGEFEKAAQAYQKVLELDPEDHGGAAVRIASMGFGDTPPKAPDAYVETLFDQHAEAFEDILVDQLEYCVPLMVPERIRALGLGPFKKLLDLGCGTGLTGGALRDICEEMVGLDLSENMVEIAHEKDLYEMLYVSEAADFLEDNDDGPFDIVTATDVLPYVGFLEELFFGVADNLEAGGLFFFSSETLPADVLGERDFMVGPHQRFAHAEGYVRKVLASARFEVLEMGDITVRLEDGKPIAGHLVVARKLAA